ncbi:MAG: PAS domain S-box protein [Opitutae bacterium]|nr:PAS domain S-box protein [Opitutae bacterium]
MPPATRLPAAIAAVSGTIGVLADPALITTDQWRGGGVEIILANEKFAELTGYAVSGLIGQNTRLFHGARTAVLSPGAVKDAPAARLVQGEGWLYRKDDKEFYAAWSFSPILADGRPTGFLFATYRDISEAKRMQEALLHSQRLDTVGLLASGVAHDFNNLLSVINGYCEIMAAKIAGVPAAQRDLQEIHRAGLKASAIARQILEFSRRQETEIKVINFNTLIREIAEIIRRVAGDDIRLELRLASDLGNARVNPTQFQQVLLNLCFNARDAMPHGGKLCIRTYNQELAAAAARLRTRHAEPVPAAAGKDRRLYAVLQVSDTGKGMDPALRDSIFDPFFTTKPHGTGLGLATVLGIVRVNPTQFQQVLLNLCFNARDAMPHGGKLCIRTYLATDGYQVAEVASPEQAVEIVNTGGLRPQLLITNCSSRAGVALVKKMHAADPRMRLLCTSPELPGQALPDFPAKACAHLPKPFALSTLLRTVRILLDSGAR